MRKVFSFMMTTADGYYEGEDQSFDWPNVDAQFNDFAVQQLDELDTLVFGRVTYELMVSYWPTPAAEQDDPRVVERMNNTAKLIASRTLADSDWANTRLTTNPADELRKLKSEPGKEIGIFGSSNLTVSLLPTGVVDELRIMVNPVVLGSGKSLFNGADEPLGLRLMSARPFDSGNVLLTYRPASRG